MEPQNEALRAELKEMVEVDQELRRKTLASADNDSDSREIWAQIADVDQKNTARMRQIIDTHGWPGKTLVGEDGAWSAWLLVQHADADRAFQKHCLGLMTAAGPAEVSPAHIAYLVDRVRVGEGKPQLYGTQFWTDEHGQFGPWLIEDEADVDERRAGVGLEPLDEYRKKMAEL